MNKCMEGSAASASSKEPVDLCSDEEGSGLAEPTVADFPAPESDSANIRRDFRPLQPTSEVMARPTPCPTAFDVNQANALATAVLSSTLAMQQLRVVSQMVDKISSRFALQGHLPTPSPRPPQGRIPIETAREAARGESDGSAASSYMLRSSSSQSPHVAMGRLQPTQPPYPPPHILIAETVDDEAIAVRIQLETLGGTTSSDSERFMQRAFKFMREQNDSVVKIKEIEELDVRVGQSLDEEVFPLPVDEVFFTQRTIGERFRDGRFLEETIAQLHSGEIHPLRNGFLKLRVWHVCGRYHNVDNRRLFCMRWHQRQLSMRKDSELEVVYVYVELLGHFTSWRNLQMLLQRFDTDSSGCLVKVRSRQS